MRTFALQSLETIINKYLQMDADTILRLAKLNNKVIRIVITDWNISLDMVVSHDHINLQPQSTLQPDTMIKGKLESFVHLSRASGSNSALFKNHMEIIGDLYVGEIMREILSKIDIDWEEQVSKIVGDVAAHQLGNFVRKVKKVTRNVVNTVELNLQEFLHYEVRLLPTQKEIDCFIQEVSTLRNDVERAEARLNILCQRRGKII